MCQRQCGGTVPVFWLPDCARVTCANMFWNSRDRTSTPRARLHLANYMSPNRGSWILARNEMNLRIEMKAVFASQFANPFFQKQESSARWSVVQPCIFPPVFRHRRGDGSICTRSQRLVWNCWRAALHIASCGLIDNFYSVTLPFAGRKTNSSSMRTAKWMAVTVAKPLKTNPAPRFDLG